jgi:hypothetical protein
LVAVQRLDSHEQSTAGTDDGWRRTATGWERLAEAGSSSPARWQMRFDVHPAGLALAQLLAVGFAFLFAQPASAAGQGHFPAGTRTFVVGETPRWHSPAWLL